MFEYKSAYTVEPMSTGSIEMPESSEYRQAVVPGVRQATFVDHPIELTWGDAFKSTLKYDTVLTSIANVLSKPNQYDKYWLESGAKEQAFSVLENMYPSMSKELKESYKANVNSPEDLDWFAKVANNKMTAEVAWSSHPTAGIAGVLADPANALGIGAGAWLQSSKIGAKFISSMDKLPKVGQKAAYAGIYGTTGALSATPEVLWNFEDPDNILIAGFISGGIAAGVSAGVKASKIDEKLTKSYKADVDPTKPAEEVFKETSEGKKVSTFNKIVANTLGLVDVVEQAVPGLGISTLGMPAKGLRYSADSAIARQHSLASQRRIEFKKFTDALEKIPGLFERGVKEHIMGMFGGKTSMLSALEKNIHYQNAIAYISTKYNYDTAQAIRTAELKKIADIGAEESKDAGKPLDIQKFIDAGDVHGAEQALNEFRSEVYIQKMKEYVKNYERIPGMQSGTPFDLQDPKNTQLFNEMVEFEREHFARFYPEDDIPTVTQLMVKNGTTKEELVKHYQFMKDTDRYVSERSDEIDDISAIQNELRKFQASKKANPDSDALDLEISKLEGTLKVLNESLEAHRARYEKAWPTKPLMPPEPKGRYSANSRAFVNIKDPNMDNLLDIEKQIVQAWQDSGLGEGLGKMVNKDGIDLKEVRVDKNYFHTRMSLNSIDSAVDMLVNGRTDLTGHQIPGIKDTLADKIAKTTEEMEHREARLRSYEADLQMYQDEQHSFDTLIQLEFNKRMLANTEADPSTMAFFNNPHNRAMLKDDIRKSLMAEADEELKKKVAIEEAKTEKEIRALLKKQEKIDFRTKAGKARLKEFRKEYWQKPENIEKVNTFYEKFKPENGYMTSKRSEVLNERIEGIKQTLNAEKKSQKYAQTELDIMKKQTSETEMKTTAYKMLMAQLGRQMADYLGRRNGLFFDPLHIGCILMMSMQDETGHYALKAAINSVKADMADRLNSMVQLMLLNSNDLGLDRETVRALRAHLDGTNIVEASAGLSKMNAPKAVGEASAFKERFLWDYNVVDDVTGLSLARLLDGNMYNAAIHNIEEESSRVALSGIKVKLDDKEFQLNTGENINAVQDLLRDKLKDEQGYNSEEATFLAELWGNSVLGRPTGAKLGPKMQAATTFAQMMQLKNSGIYNIVEMTNVAMQFGIGRACKHFCEGIRMGLNTSTITNNDAMHLKNIVSKQYAIDGRIQPEVSVITNDLTDVADDRFTRGIMWSGQFMRWANGQQHTAQLQANMCAAIYEEIMDEAIKKNDWSALDKMGSIYNPAERTRIKQMHDKFGMDVGAWTDYNMAQTVIRRCLDMTANTALMARRGELPPFLSTDWGKIAFAYQTFVWKAHNSLLRRFKNEGGPMKAAMFVMSQIPLAILGSAVIQLLKGNDPFKDPEKMAVNVASSMSSLGLYAAALNILARGEVGGTAPALGAISTLLQSGGAALSGDFSKLLENMPLLGGVLPYRMGLAAFGNM